MKRTVNQKSSIFTQGNTLVFKGIHEKKTNISLRIKETHFLTPTNIFNSAGSEILP